MASPSRQQAASAQGEHDGEARSAAPDPHAVRPARSGLARLGWASLGVFLVAVGALGIYVPGLPTTPFLILAAACFARSSQRLYDRLLASPLFGPVIRDFRDGKGIPYRARRWALGLMWTFVAFAVTLGIPASWWPAKLAVLLTAGIGTWVIFRLPVRR